MPRLAVAAAVVLVALASAAGCTKVVAGEPVAAPDPAPITRAELLKRYAEINPIDESATPHGVDSTTRQVCSALDKGLLTTDQIIEMINEVYGPRSTEVTELIVSYGCPQHIDAFK